jgi:hypothetical protein
LLGEKAIAFVDEFTGLKNVHLYTTQTFVECFDYDGCCASSFIRLIPSGDLEVCSTIFPLFEGQGKEANELLSLFEGEINEMVTFVHRFGNTNGNGRKALAFVQLFLSSKQPLGDAKEFIGFFGDDGGKAFDFINYCNGNNHQQFLSDHFKNNGEDALRFFSQFPAFAFPLDIKSIDSFLTKCNNEAQLLINVLANNHFSIKKTEQVLSKYSAEQLQQDFSLQTTPSSPSPSPSPSPSRSRSPSFSSPLSFPSLPSDLSPDQYRSQRLSLSNNYFGGDVAKADKVLFTFGNDFERVEQFIKENFSSSPLQCGEYLDTFGQDNKSAFDFLHRFNHHGDVALRFRKITKNGKLLHNASTVVNSINIYSSRLLLQNIKDRKEREQKEREQKEREKKEREKKEREKKEKEQKEWLCMFRKLHGEPVKDLYG